MDYVSYRTVRTVAIVFFVVQGVGVIIWWAYLLTFRDAYALFFPRGTPASDVYAMLLPDLFIFAGSSLLAAYALARDHSWSWPLVCIHAGAALYAALYGVSLPLFGEGGWLGGAMMLPSLVIPVLLAWLLRPSRREST